MLETNCRGLKINKQRHNHFFSENYQSALQAKSWGRFIMRTEDVDTDDHSEHETDDAHEIIFGNTVHFIA